MPSSNVKLCACGEPRQFRKHHCDACNFKRTVEATRRENKAKAEAVKSTRRTKSIGESGYPGVYRCSHTKTRWTGEIKANGKRVNIGTWLTPKEAFDARLKLYFELFGEYPVDNVAVKTYNESVKGEANTPLERYNQVLQYLINIA